MHGEWEAKLGATSLMYACQQGKPKEVAEIIVNKPYLVSTRDRTLKTALHYCAEAGKTSCQCASLLLSNAPQLLYANDQDGYTVLHLAVIAGNTELIELLLANGADVNALDKEGHSCVHWATVCGEIKSLEIVMVHGGNPNVGDMHGGYPVHYASQMCGPGSGMPTDSKLGLIALKLLLERGADPNSPDNFGRHPIMWAASAGSPEAILVLAKAGARIQAEDKDGLTALHCAASRGHTDCIEVLINLCGAEVDVIDSNGCSAFFYAVTLGHVDSTILLLKQGSNTNLQDRKGRTAVHCGAAKGQLETLKIVDEWGGNLWNRTARGDYPLHEAVASGRRCLVEWLLSKRPDSVNSPNNDGRCPLHVSALHGNIEMCKALLDAGSLVNPVMRGSKGGLATPLDAALHKGHRGCAKYLQLHGGVAATKLNKKAALLRGPRISSNSDTGNEIYNKHEGKVKRSMRFLQQKSTYSSDESLNEAAHLKGKSKPHLRRGSVKGLKDLSSDNSESRLKRRKRLKVKKGQEDIIESASHLKPKIENSSEEDHVDSDVATEKTKPYQKNRIPRKMSQKSSKSKSSSIEHKKLDFEADLKSDETVIKSAKGVKSKPFDSPVKKSQSLKSKESSIKESEGDPQIVDILHYTSNVQLAAAEIHADSREFIVSNVQISEVTEALENENFDISKTEDEKSDLKNGLNSQTEEKEGLMPTEEKEDINFSKIDQEKGPPEASVESSKSEEKVKHSVSKDDSIPFEHKEMTEDEQVTDVVQTTLVNVESIEKDADEIILTSDALILRNQETDEISKDGCLENGINEENKTNETEITQEDLENYDTLMKEIESAQKEASEIVEIKGLGGEEKDPGTAEKVEEEIKESLKSHISLQETISGEDLNEKSFTILEEGDLIEDEKEETMESFDITSSRIGSLAQQSMKLMGSSEGLSSVADEFADSERVDSPLECDSSQLMDSGIEPSPRRTQFESKAHKDSSRIPRLIYAEVSPARSLGGKESGISVTRSVQSSIRKFHLERRIFHELLELKHLQIRAGKTNEAVFVKRLIDKYRGEVYTLGLEHYTGPYKFKDFEKFLYDQLRLLHLPVKNVIPKLPSDEEKYCKLKLNSNESFSKIPSNPRLCTEKTHRCHHATYAYTGIPSAAYVMDSHHKSKGKHKLKSSFLPKISNDENHGEVAKTIRFVDPSLPLTLELSHGHDKQIISLPTENLDKDKKYYVTFTVKGSGVVKSDVEQFKQSFSF